MAPPAENDRARASPSLAERIGFALVLVAALLSRADEVRHAALLLDADSALGALMGQRIWREATNGYVPIMLDGQDYLGSFEAFLYAPLNALVPLAQAMALTEVALVGAFLFLLRALLRESLGSLGALAGCAVVAVGTPIATEFTTVAPMGYVSNLVIGITLLYLAHRAAGAPVGPGRLAGLAALGGFGYWNSPQVAPYALASILALLPRSAVFAAGRRGDLLATRTACGAAGLVILAATALAATLALQLGGPTEVWGLSLSRPDRYTPRAGLALALALIAFELACSTNRRAWIWGLAAAVTGAVAGTAPLLAYRFFWPPTGIVPVLQFRLAEVLPNVPIVGGQVASMLVGPETWANAAVGFPAYGAWRAMAMTTLGLGLAIALGRTWRDVLALARLRAERVPVTLLLIVPAGATMVQLLLRGGIQWPRYFVALLPVAAVSIAHLVAAPTASGARGRSRLAIAWVALVLAGHVLQQADRAVRLERRSPDEARVIAHLTRTGLVYGYAQYWTAYRLDAIANGALHLDCHYDGGSNYHRFPHHAEAIARHTGDLVRLYDLGQDREDESLLRVFLDEGDRAGWGVVAERRAWGGGRYVVQRYARRAAVR